MNWLRSRWIGVVVALIYCIVGIPAADAGWYAIDQNVNTKNYSSYQVWMPGQTSQLQPGSNKVEACFAEPQNFLPATQLSSKNELRNSALKKGLTCVQRTVIDVHHGDFPGIIHGLTDGAKFIDGFSHGLIDGLNQAVIGTKKFIESLFTHPGVIYNAAKKLIDHPSILYKILKHLGHDAAHAFATIVCSPAYQSGKESGKIVGVLLLNILLAKGAGFVAKEIAGFSSELEELGIGVNGSIGYDITTNIRQTLINANRIFRSGGTAYVKIGNTVLKTAKDESVLFFTNSADGQVPESVVKKIFLKLAGTDKLPEPIDVPGGNTGILGEKAVRYTIRLSNGEYITLRNFASSIKRSGPVWTINTSKSDYSILGEEIKFKR